MDEISILDTGKNHSKIQKMDVDVYNSQ